MKTISKFLLALFLISIFFGCQEKEVPVNTLSKSEIKDGWELLFDGHSMDQWRGYHKSDLPEIGWGIQDNAIFCGASDMGEAGSGGDLITREMYSNFDLKLEWKINKAGNSGILYLVTEIPDEPAWHGAIEMQILDAVDFPMELKPAQLSGSAYDLVAANPDNVKPFGEWNQIEIIVDNGHVEQWQNGAKVAEYTLWTPEWEAMVMESKFKDYPEFLYMSKDGFIGLQDHGGGAWFRNIKIKKL
ncbi:3-keto-disaccharide hydrolase [Sunxiuqinia sp. A32]|uniref:3-keto-disaccharide hydrolase n=1 Tax=Sunxiuqinia sp. A32 TaxID=3461496 RepID=UPI004045384F